SGRVLVVEDEKLLESLVSRVLMRAGFDVLSAHSPAMALELLADQGEVGVDVLLTDVVMPEMNGRQLSERIESIQPGLRTVFMSGYPATVVRQRGLLPDGMNVLQKPFTNEQLLERVQGALVGQS
ncbi:MAG: response regulator, partial [Pseudomonadota bacterium]